MNLWRVEVAGTRSPERIEVAGAAAFAPAIALSRDRLAFTRLSTDTDLYRFDVGRPVQLVFGSSGGEEEPRWSPDGRRLVFGSAGSGAPGSLGRRICFPPGVGMAIWAPGRRGRYVASSAIGSFLENGTNRGTADMAANIGGILHAVHGTSDGILGRHNLRHDAVSPDANSFGRPAPRTARPSHSCSAIRQFRR